MRGERALVTHGMSATQRHVKGVDTRWSSTCTHHRPVGGSESLRASARPLVRAALARERTHWALAQLGVAVFAIALLVPASVAGSSRATTVLVASSSELGTPPIEDVAPPNQVARRIARAQSIPVTTSESPTTAPDGTEASVPAWGTGGSGAAVMVSWYGPGFFENRLPCWQWLQASGLPIQLLPDTWGVAHKTLPCGTMLTLTHGTNTITVPVVDRGPYIEGRELDLTPPVKAALGCTDLCTVVMQIR